MEGDAGLSTQPHTAQAGATTHVQRRKSSLEPFTHISQGAGCPQLSS